MSGLLVNANIACIPVPTPFIVGPVNVYLIKDDPPILIDTGPKTDEAYDALVAGLRAEGCATRDIGLILLTHGHLDHIGLLARLQQESGALSYAHPFAAERARQYEQDVETSSQFYIDIMSEFGTPAGIIEVVGSDRESYRIYGEQAGVDHVLEDKGRIGKYTVHFVPGHSSSDVIFHDEEKNLGFVGDHLLKLINPNPLIRRALPGQQRAHALSEFMRSLKTTRSLNLGLVCPGHGAPFQNANTVVDRLERKMEQRTERVLEFLRDGPMSPYQVSARLFPELEILHIYLGLSIAVGHLELLEERGLAYPEYQMGVLHYVRSEA